MRYLTRMTDRHERMNHRLWFRLNNDIGEDSIIFRFELTMLNKAFPSKRWIAMLYLTAADPHCQKRLHEFDEKNIT